MKVSIVTISFNQRQFLREAIESVLAQDYENIEYIVVDPGSTDGSRDVINEYESRLAVKVFEPDMGPADGLNRGFSLATGDILAYLNSDDMLLPSAVSSAVAAFRTHPTADVVYADGYIVDANGQVLRRFHSGRFTPTRYIYEASTVMQQSTFFRRTAFQDVGGFNVENPINWDTEFLLECALSGKSLLRVPGYWSLFRIHDQSITAQSQQRNERIVRLRGAHRLRMFERVMGRRPRRSDRIVKTFLRLHRYIAEPVKTAQRVCDFVIRNQDLHRSKSPLRSKKAYAEELSIGDPSKESGE